MSHEYVAGYLDADGCIDIAKQKGRFHYVRVQIGSLKPEPLLEFSLKYGGYVAKKKVPSGNPYFNWVMRGGTVKEFLMAVEPFLINKKEEVKLALEFCNLIDPHRGSRPVTEEEFQLRDQYRNRLSAMKPSSARRLANGEP